MWIEDDTEQWRAIMQYERLSAHPMVRDAFLAALDEIQRLRKLVANR